MGGVCLFGVGSRGLTRCRSVLGMGGWLGRGTRRIWGRWCLSCCGGLMARVGRPPLKQIPLKVSVQELADIDRVRGDVPRARWMKELMRSAVEAHDMTRGGIVHGAFSHVEEPTLDLVAEYRRRFGG